MDGIYSGTKYLEMKPNYNGNSVHSDSLQVGQEYQDFIVEKFITELGISISLFQSKKYQFNVGESLQGVEIKYDARSTGDCTYYECTPSGNVAIEVAERSNKNVEYFTKSGIYRIDNSWIYVVGNYHQAWVFAKSTLQLLHKSGKYRTVSTLPTIQTMLLPVEKADIFCAKKLIF